MVTEPTRRMPPSPDICADTVLLVNMSQLVIGSALGFLIAQGVLYASRHAIGLLKHDELRQWIATLIPSRGSSIVGGFIQHAGLIGASVAVIALGAWATRDYLAAKSARSAAIADILD